MEVSIFYAKSQMDIPKPRGVLYDELGIYRTDGARIARILGYGERTPFTPEEELGFRNAVAEWRLWSHRGLSFNTFCEHLEEKINGEKE